MSSQVESGERGTTDCISVWGTELLNHKHPLHDSSGSVVLVRALDEREMCEKITQVALLLVSGLAGRLEIGPVRRTGVEERHRSFLEDPS